MARKNIPYQSFCWVIGTTSFRTAKLNLKIEQQLLLLDEFYTKVSKEYEWEWNNALQEKYYNFMREKKFLYGEAKRKDKDAREKTSGLVDIGLLTVDRLITNAGRELLNIANDGVFDKDNILNIDNDSFVYLKQLLKTSVNVNGNYVRPFLVTIKCLLELEYLTYDEFKYFVPLISTAKDCEQIINYIRLYRNGTMSIEDVIYSKLISMGNYQSALKELRENAVNEELICLIGLNRKSRSYDRPYFDLYNQIKSIFIDGSACYEKLLSATKNVKHSPGILWRNLLFKSTNISVIRKKGKSSISEHCPFTKCRDENELKEAFFKYLHVFKAMATLADYFDLNRRYFNLTDILIFDDSTIKLDVLPKYYFSEIMEKLYEDTYLECDRLITNTSLSEISEAFNADIRKVYSSLSNDLGVNIENAEQAKSYIDDERYGRFNALINRKFTDDVLIELLKCFEERNDSRIEEIVTDEATIPTIFEYVLGIIWYKISERQGNILDYMKLSLEANLLPKTHAAGGSADIVYKYGASATYPKHDLLIEATLAEKDNQRRMEMEPVSRHLGDYRLKSNNQFDYSVFISPYLDPNVISDFRYRKIIPYEKGGKRIDGMKIISVDTSCLKKIIANQVKYRQLYVIFEKFYNMPLNSIDWHGGMIKEVTGG